MRVLFTGTRKALATDGPAVYKTVMREVPVPMDMVIIHGGAKGVDAIADAIGRGYLGVPVEVYPADWEKDGRAAGPIRNQRMLDEGKPDLVLAYPSTKHASRGTMDMVRRAKAAGVRTVITYLS